MSSLQYSDWNNEDNKKGMANNQNVQQKKERTIKNNRTLRREAPPKNQQAINDLINKLHNSEEEEEEDYSPLNPLGPPESAGLQRVLEKQSATPSITQQFSTEEKVKEAFTNLPSMYAKEYYQQYVPMMNQKETNIGKDNLTEKLDYIIHLLQEQQDEKTGHVTEELILYSFLGIFVIFVVDSFARAGKYVR